MLALFNLRHFSLSQLRPFSGPQIHAGFLAGPLVFILSKWSQGPTSLAWSLLMISPNLETAEVRALFGVSGIGAGEQVAIVLNRCSRNAGSMRCPLLRRKDEEKMHRTETSIEQASSDLLLSILSLWHIVLIQVLWVPAVCSQRVEVTAVDFSGSSLGCAAIQRLGWPCLRWRSSFHGASLPFSFHSHTAL